MAKRSQPISVERSHPVGFERKRVKPRNERSSRVDCNDFAEDTIGQENLLAHPGLTAYGKIARISPGWPRGCGRPQLSQFPPRMADFLLLPNLLEEFSVVVGQHCHSNLIKI